MPDKNKFLRRLERLGLSIVDLGLMTNTPECVALSVRDGGADPTPAMNAVLELFAGASQDARGKAILAAKSGKQWRPIPGYSGYEASEDGEVRRRVTGNATHPGRVLKLKIDRGYWAVKLYADDGKQRSMFVSRAVCLAFHGESNGLQACHRNGIKADNRAENLYWGTPLENGQDRMFHAVEGHKPREANWEYLGKEMGRAGKGYPYKPLS